MISLYIHSLDKILAFTYLLLVMFTTLMSNVVDILQLCLDNT